MELRVAKSLLVSKILVADGIMTENERLFLDAFMRKLGLTPDERQKVVDLEGWDDAEKVVAALPEDDRRQVLDTLLSAASADGRLSPLEVTAVQAITAALGL